MKFNVISYRSEISKTGNPRAYLVKDAWNDYSYRTQFDLVIIDQMGEKVEVGSVKIAQIGQTEQDRDIVPRQFNELDDSFFSLGQSENYYETLNLIDDYIRDLVYSSLRDCAKDLSIFDAVKNEGVMGASLLRFVSSEAVPGRFHRLANGNGELTPFNFSYEFANKSGGDPVTINFDVTPNSNPPTNIHVVISRNGVGKTTFLNGMTASLMDTESDYKGVFLNRGDGQFSNLVSVAFSAFDNSDPLREETANKSGVRYWYVGLKFQPSSDADKPKRPPGSIKTPSDLVKDFIAAVSSCRTGPRKNRWYSALETLNADPLFKEAGVKEICLEYGDETDSWKDGIDRVFSRLSSGHKIILLTITRLIELVDEKTLVLLDEPESHLHPPLLAAFIRTLSDLLIKRNGVSIIATHSPVVLQEVPKTCVWYLSRIGESVRADRPEIETFGENVGTLTREVFGLEVTQSGFHKMIHDAVERGSTYEDILAYFANQLGLEARSIAHGLIALRKSSHSKAE